MQKEVRDDLLFKRFTIRHNVRVLHFGKHLNLLLCIGTFFRPHLQQKGRRKKTNKQKHAPKIKYRWVGKGGGGGGGGGGG